MSVSNAVSVVNIGLGACADGGLVKPKGCRSGPFRWSSSVCVLVEHLGELLL